MSHYVYGTRVSYADYLQAKSFVTDIQRGQRGIEHAVSKQTREIVASQEELHAQEMKLHGSGFGQLSENLEGIAFRLDKIHGAIKDLDATFHWGFTKMLASMGRLNDSLEQLIAIAKTPAQTWAYNQYKIARDAMRKELYPEALESLNNAISGLGSNPGYKLEYRFHHTKGIILLGSVDNCDQRLLDLPQAEQSFLTAARYARTDYQKDAGLAFLAAGWSAYCQGKMEEAIAHTQDAIRMHPNFAEALFQLAKINMYLSKVDIALPLLGKAITSDRNYSLKAAADGDFQKHSESLRIFLDQCRSQARDAAQDAIRLADREIPRLREWHADEASKVDHDTAISNLRLAHDCFAHRTFYGYLDAREKAEIANTTAQRATQTQQSALRKKRDQLLHEINETRNRVQARAQDHSPSTWTEAEKEVARLTAINVEPGRYEEWVTITRQAKITQDQMAKVETLTRQREDSCYAITAYNNNLQKSATDLSSGWAFAAFCIAGIGSYIFLIISGYAGRDNEKVAVAVVMVLLGWIPAAIIGICFALVVRLLGYMAIKSGAGQRPFPPKN